MCVFSARRYYVSLSSIYPVSDCCQSVKPFVRSSFLSSFAAAAFLPKIGRHATPRVNRACVKKVLPSPASLSLERMQHPVHVLGRKDFSKICQLSRFLFLSAALSFSLPFFPLSCLLFLRVSLRMSWLGKQFINSLLPWFLFTKKAQKKNTRPTSAPGSQGAPLLRSSGCVNAPTRTRREVFEWDAM